MARRQRVMVPRKRRDWIALQNFTGTAMVDDTPSGVPLISVDSDAVGLTVARIVGTVHVTPDTTADVGSYTWGIHKSQEVTSTNTMLDPMHSGDRQANSWLHLCTVHTAGVQAMWIAAQQEVVNVDIKVMRKVEPNEHLSLVWNTNLTNGGCIFWALRMLVLK